MLKASFGLSLRLETDGLSSRHAAGAAPLVSNRLSRPFALAMPRARFTAFIAIVVAVTAFGRALAHQGMPPPEAWTRAEAAIVRLPVASFPGLPAGVSADLDRRGCRVPQTYAARAPANVIRGEFTHAGQTDWAVLCSVDGQSAILVFHAGGATSVDELARQPDAGYLQLVAPGVIGYSRAITAMTLAELEGRRSRLGPLAPSTLEHGALDDAFIEKASVIRYWDGRRWLELLGSD